MRTCEQYCWAVVALNDYCFTSVRQQWGFCSLPLALTCQVHWWPIWDMVTTWFVWLAFRFIVAESHAGTCQKKRYCNYAVTRNYPQRMHVLLQHCAASILVFLIWWQWDLTTKHPYWLRRYVLTYCIAFSHSILRYWSSGHATWIGYSRLYIHIYDLVHRCASIQRSKNQTSDCKGIQMRSSDDSAK